MDQEGRQGNLKEMTGTIFDIQHFSTHDGPGVRTTVFLKGCPLHCEWCHNPESQSRKPQIMFHKQRCIGCGACGGNHFGPVPAIKDGHYGDNSDMIHKEEAAVSISEYSRICQVGAMELCGKEMTVREVIDEVMKDEAYYRHSGGGMTLSGGEPAFQPEFSAELLKEAREAGIRTAMETSGCGRPEDYLERFLPLTDLFIWDVKLVDKDLYRKYTGGDLDRVLDNLRKVYRTGAQMLLRMILIPEIHLQGNITEATARLLEEFPDAQKEVIPYHLLGNAKRTKLGLQEIRFKEPTPEETKHFAESIGAEI